MKRSLKVTLCLTLSAMLFLAGCGAKSADEANYAPAYGGLENYSLSEASDGSFFSSQNLSAEYDMKEAAEELSDPSENFVRQSSEKLVYTCVVNMETLTFDSTVTAIHDLIQKYEGFIDTENKSDSATGWYFENYKKTSGTLSEYIVIRIPTAHYDEFLRELETGEGKITGINRNVKNITTAYNDTATTIESLKTQEERLLKMMKEAQTIEEMLAIEDRLTEVQTELSIYESRLSGYDLDVAYSTITLNVREVLEYTPVNEPQKVSTFGDRLKNTLKDSWDNFTGFLEDLLFFLIRALPVLIVLGAIGFLIVFIVVRSIRSGKDRKAKRAVKYAAAAEVISDYDKPEEEK